ncbi:hypothetical protein BDZ91DRAFT_792904 [Kalaharituber pfeilii]|nr:hypothetical protein BDZ91DRAFT_792904 [Kalaharituber pfeilii]
MRVKVRYTSGSGSATVLTIPNSDPISSLLAQIRQYGSIAGDVEIKHGFPPKVLDLFSFSEDTPLDQLPFRLDGDQLTVSGASIGEGRGGNETPEPAAAAPPPPPEAPKPAPKPAPAPRSNIQSLSSLNKASSTSSAFNAPPPTAGINKDDPPDVVLQGRGTVVLRVMEDDNSCLFRAISYSICDSQFSPIELRQLVVSTILADPVTYNEAVLGQKVDDYCSWITMDSSWGGGIELAIFAKFFDVEIMSMDVSSASVIRFNEGSPNLCILVYSGIHYDAIALSPITAYSFQSHPDQDIRIFDRNDLTVIQAARELVQQLKKRKYFTDTNKFTLRCEICREALVGQAEASQHAKITGHMEFGEY